MSCHVMVKKREEWKRRRKGKERREGRERNKESRKNKERGSERMFLLSPRFPAFPALSYFPRILALIMHVFCLAACC